jgi:hypothetical protein
MSTAVMEWFTAVGLMSSLSCGFDESAESGSQLYEADNMISKVLGSFSFGRLELHPADTAAQGRVDRSSAEQQILRNWREVLDEMAIRLSYARSGEPYTKHCRMNAACALVSALDSRASREFRAVVLIPCLVRRIRASKGRYQHWYQALIICTSFAAASRTIIPALQIETIIMIDPVTIVACVAGIMAAIFNGWPLLRRLWKKLSAKLKIQSES